MKFDTTLLICDLSQMPALTQAAEAIVFAGIWVAETAHDAFLPLTLAAEHSQRLSLGTSIALAFLRSPAAQAGADLPGLDGLDKFFPRSLAGHLQIKARLNRG
jgi:alkanesulfonate monooxygenase SsuD/methylene tetrahydromethanopterin reductase-like flavin-dependent oxidoreductase (luciferase family)